MKFALAGNPNSGKTTLFNTLTGSTAHVGNWAGVTVDRKEGVYRGLKEPVQVIDLPGIYSLSPYSPEEVVARNYLLEEKPDCIINIVDATNLERNLYLTTQLLEVDMPLVIALNMMDTVRKDGTIINVPELEALLGVPVVPISALHAEGVKTLMERAYRQAQRVIVGKSVLSKSAFGRQYDKIERLLRDYKVEHPVFHAVKLLEGDSLEAGFHPELAARVEQIKATIALNPNLEGDFEAAVADARYQYITGTVKSFVQRPAFARSSLRTQRLDKVLTHKVWGIPIFLLLMYTAFHFTFAENFLFIPGVPSPGVWLQGLMETLIGYISIGLTDLLTALGASPWVFGLVVDGVVAGVGAVLSFLPQIMLLFFFLSVLEDTGYMARAAFLMDRLLRRFGLSGKAFMPMLMGFGCSVPAIMGTRTLSTNKERRMTILLIPFFSCGAKMPIWVVFAAALFPGYADLALIGVYVLGVVVAICAALILQKTVLREQAAPFIMELPAYRIPQARSLFIHLWDKLRDFVVRASTIIAGATVVIWFLSNFDFTLSMVEANSAQSILGVFGNFIRPIFEPLGFASGDTGWQAVVAILTGFIAKEMVVSTLGVLYGTGDALESEEASTALIAAIAAAFSPLAAVSFMAFNLLSTPCMAAVAAANSELKSRKWMAFALCFWTVTAWVVSFVIFQVGTLLGLGG